MGRLIVEHASRVPFPPDAVWAWYARPGAFERLTPPWERMRVLERTGHGLENGSRVTLEVHAGPVPVRWTALHRDVQPGRGFVDEQVEGPFASWVHEHSFTPDGDGTRVADRITCVPPLGAVGAAFGTPYLREKLKTMLRYRHALLARDLEAHARAALPPLRIAVTGATGLIGSALVPFLTTGGHSVVRLVRRTPEPGDLFWQPERSELDPRALEGVDAVIHLAGEGIADRRWTPERKARLRESRTGPTALLARALAALERKPRALVAVSATGLYGDRGDELLSDRSAPGQGFLPELAQAWEEAAEPAAQAGIRVAHPRFGIVLSPAGGALGKMLPAFLAGGGGPLGGGRQWMPWSSIDDAVGTLHFAVASEHARGGFNAVAPEPVRNADLTRTLARVLQRPAIVPVPATALRLLFGEMADATLLASARAVPEALVRWGYTFRHPGLEGALRHLLGR